MKKLAILFLCLLLTGCSKASAPKLHAQTIDLMEDFRTAAVEYEPLSAEASAAITDFSQELLRHCLPEEHSVLLSPLSVLNALAMTANGAQGETRAQMETAFHIQLDPLNRSLRQYQAMEQDAFTIANSIWLRDEPGLAIEDRFLQTNGEFYQAAVFRAPFDETTKDDINRWIHHNTKGRIENMIREIPDMTRLYLINALTFERTWEDTYNPLQVQEGIFTKDDGSTQTADLMYCSTETYLEDDNAAGFLKPYKGGRYVFAALRPNDGVTVDEYLATLEPGDLFEILQNASGAEVRTAMPKFEADYRCTLEEGLQEMGMTHAFDPELADFYGIGSYKGYPLYIETVHHATYMKVNETGTEAAAATVVEVPGEEAAPVLEEPKTVYLDKPFVYLIWDQIDSIPLFIGVMREVPPS